MSIAHVVIAVAGSYVLFFIISNFGAWFTSGLYPMTIEGLMQANVAAIPLFQNSLLGNIVITAFLFGGFAALQRNVRALAESN